MKKSKQIINKIVTLSCLSLLLLVLFTSCAKEKEEPKEPETTEQEESVEVEPEEPVEVEPEEPVVAEPEPIETMPAGLQELKFIDFGIESGDYIKGSYKGEYFGETLDNTVVSGKLTFTPRGDTHVLIGGKKAWGGFGISAIVPLHEDEWVLRLYDTNNDKKGVKFQPYYFYSDVAGVPLIGQELDFKVSIQYVDNDGDGLKNDVKLGMWFADKLYDNKYIYLKDFTDLSYSMGTWMTLVVFEDAQLTIK